MKEVYINVSGQKLSAAPSCGDFVDGSQRFVRFIFYLGEDWEGLTVAAQFAQSGTAYNVLLDEQNCAYLPPEIKEGTFSLTIRGTAGDVIATTNTLIFRATKNSFVSDAQSTEISQSLYNQLVDKVNSIASWDVEGVEEITEKVNGLMDVDVSASKDGTTTTVTVTGKDGIPHSVKILDGKDGTNGKDGAPGKDGINGTNGKDGIDGKDGVDGKDGTNGVDGHSPVVTAVKAGKVTSITVDGTVIATVNDGSDGKDGSPGADGAPGAKGDPGKDGANGVDGVTPHIGDNGHWYLGSTDTGVKAQGADGQAGAPGEKGDKGDKGDPGATPVKGTDYWTAADKAEMVQDTKTALTAETWTFTLTDGSTVAKQVVVK